jgi:pilus assembly protein FimV
MAIRSKLLEVYAKRRDTKGFELLATQMFNLTRGEGEDWPKAQALGLTIDPENPLYQPVAAGGGAHRRRPGCEAAGRAHPALHRAGAPPAFQPAADATLDGGGLDLDLDLPLPPPVAPRTHATGREHTALSPRRPIRAATTRWTSAWMTTSPKTIPASAPPLNQRADDGHARAKIGDGLDFDLGDMSRRAPAAKAAPAPPDPTLDFGDFGLAAGRPSPKRPPTATPGAQDRTGRGVPPDRRHGRCTRPAGGSHGQGGWRAEVQGSGHARSLG